ncbi:ATP-binding protein [Rhodocyclus tenuis]|uniref:CO dehydrogenase maturation factor n=1 Tax=Rhodocyclus tenuis TaxID=1066 RepID=A0A840GAU6_RHOTE|nr:AAA family ATPase [Rhodocyclus tenuis]MBB4248601.1 CO dehydrogenase maturation factor [Rhodocyclus tenuis]
MCTQHPDGHTHSHNHGQTHAHGDAQPHDASGTRAPLRIAVVGKGGAGKTTIAGALARVLATRGLRVLAIDADPDANLASALPLDHGELPLPLAQQPELLHQTNEAAAIPDGLFLLNPDTGSLLPQSTVAWGGGQSLVALGWGKGGGEGCYCAEHALLRRVLFKASAATADVTLIDSEAGLEHLSRGTIAGVDLLLVVVEPGRRSVETAASVRQLSAALGIAHVHCVVSNYRSPAELATIRGWLGDWPPVAAFPFDDAVRLADLAGVPPQLAGEFLHAAEHLADFALALERAA